MFATILVPVDGSPNADAAVDLAADLAARHNARLNLLHVIAGVSRADRKSLRRLAATEHLTEPDVVEAMAQDVARRATGRAHACGATHVTSAVDAGDPAEIILAHAAELKADLIVLGRRGLGGLQALLLGSVSSKVLQLAACPCLIVPPAARASAKSG